MTPNNDAHDLEGDDKQGESVPKPKATGPSPSDGGKKSTTTTDGAPKADSISSTTPAPANNPVKKKKPGLTALEKELIAKLKSKSETKLGCSGFSVRPAAKPKLPIRNKTPSRNKPSLQHHAHQQPQQQPPQQYVQAQRHTQQPHALLPPWQQNHSLETQFLYQQQISQSLHREQQTEIPIPSQPQPQQQKIPARPKLPLVRTAKNGFGVGPSLPRPLAAQIVSSPQIKPPSLPPQRKSPISPELTVPQRRAQSPPIPAPKQKVALPTRQQKSLAEQRRRQAKNETPITLMELDMNEKEIHESKSLVMSFLSGMGDDSSEDGIEVGRKRGWEYDTTSSYVDSFQHDPKNRSMAYHYSVPPLCKKRKDNSK